MESEVSLDQIRPLAQKLYDELRASLFEPGHPSTPATLDISVVAGLSGNGDAGYSASRNIIRIPIPDGNLDDHDVLNAEAWPVWKVDLIEEMAHEYQDKAQPTTATARALQSKYGSRFDPKGHDETFFAAVEILAGKLDLSGEDLVKILVNGHP